MRKPLIYKASVVIVAQGYKIGYLGPRAFRYDPSTFLVVGVPIPFECQSHGTADEPLLGLRINIDPLALHELVARIGGQGISRVGEGTHTGIEPVAMDDGLSGAAERLMTTLRDPLDARVLGPGARDEVIYRTLRSEKGRVLFELTQHHTQYAAVARALDRVHAHYPQPLSVDELAGEAAMSVSAFHRAFKKVTGQSPLQYLKKVRLDKARALILSQRMPVNVAAYKVGYESPSQFSREFKRLFNLLPSSIASEAPDVAV